MNCDAEKTTECIEDRSGCKPALTGVSVKKLLGFTLKLMLYVMNSGQLYYMWTLFGNYIFDTVHAYCIMIVCTI